MHVVVVDAVAIAPVVTIPAVIDREENRMGQVLVGEGVPVVVGIVDPAVVRDDGGHETVNVPGAEKDALDAFIAAIIFAVDADEFL